MEGERAACVVGGFGAGSVEIAAFARVFESVRVMVIDRLTLTTKASVSKVVLDVGEEEVAQLDDEVVLSC